MITFTADSIEMPHINTALIKRWLKTVAAGYSKKAGDINYIFCSDDKILEVNLQFLQHNYYTDIITFDYSCAGTINGDIFISVDTVASNAQERNIDFTDELHRVIVHGVLHLTGQNDKRPDDRAEMTRKENLALDTLKNM